jgi:hypothetical protein
MAASPSPGPARVFRLAVAGLLLASAAAAVPVRAQRWIQQPPQNRPKGMALLIERDVAGGKQALGVFGAEKDPAQPGLWRIKVWEELPNDVKVRHETVRCTPAAPMRITNDGRSLILRELNPGGAISSANRTDHLVWWATCFPEQAGKDPAGLAGLARQLGYSGHLVEKELIVPAGSR